MRRSYQYNRHTDGYHPLRSNKPSSEPKHFNTLSTYLDYCESNEANCSELSGGNGLIPSIQNKTWSGANTFKETISLARFGWADGLKRVLATRITAIEDYINPETKLDVRYMDAPQSGMLDISRVLEGDPDCWQEYEMIQEPSPRIIRMLVYGTFSAGISTETIIKNGCALMGVIDALESRGIRVHVDIGYTDGSSTLTYTAKQSDAMLDREQLVYLIAHPSSSRWLMRTAFSTTFGDWGHTSPQEIPNEVSRNYDITTPMGLLGYVDQTNSVKWLLNILREKFGLEISG